MKKKPYPQTINQCSIQDCMKCGYLKKLKDGFKCTEKGIFEDEEDKRFLKSFDSR